LHKLFNIFGIKEKSFQGICPSDKVQQLFSQVCRILIVQQLGRFAEAGKFHCAGHLSEVISDIIIYRSA
jgi:hypothetical protein